jgi:hypothetical protein
VILISDDPPVLPVTQIGAANVLVTNNGMLAVISTSPPPEVPVLTVMTPVTQTGLA